MRIKVKPSDFYEGDWNEKECAYPYCSIPIFYTDNISAEYCSDQHRFKGNQLKNKPKNDLLKRENNQYKINSLALEKLYLKGFINPTPRDLKIVDFDFRIRKTELKIGDHTGFAYFDYILIIKKDDTLEIVNNKK